MANTRSPNYPVIGLPESIKKARKIWAGHHGKMSREVAVKHMGYNTLDGSPWESFPPSVSLVF